MSTTTALSMEYLTLSSGDRMPAVGLGMWKIEAADAPAVVAEAVQCGYRHFDSACDYGNEESVGVGLSQALHSKECRREDLWVTSKLWNTYHAAGHVRPAVERSLKALRLDYLDLYLVHFPIALEYVDFATRYPPEWLFDPDVPQPRMRPVDIPVRETWQAMEELVAAGLVRNIGVCNFNVALLRELLTSAEIQPAALQVELHPYLTQEKLLRFCRDKQIVVTGFSPLGAGSYVPLGMAERDESVLQESVVCEAASHHGKTPAQIVLRWAVQRGTAIVPKTTRPERLRENIALFDFELSGSEMKAITALDRNRRFNDPGEFCESAFNTFFPIFD